MSTAPAIDLTLIPPGPITTAVDLEIRGSVNAVDAAGQTASFVVIVADKNSELHRQAQVVPANRPVSLRHQIAAAELGPGTHQIALEVQLAGTTHTCSREIEILPCSCRSPKRLGGAWVGLLHWDADEARYWNRTLRDFTDDDWRELVRDMHAVGLETIVIQESWRNPIWYGEHYHQMTLDNYRETYAGRAFYPSELYPGRRDIMSADPIAVILDAADALKMHVFVGVGLYAHFDYSRGSLAWHKDVVSELWDHYGHHPSLYGWYVAEESNGWVKPHEQRYWERTTEFRKDVVNFFREFRIHCDSFAPTKPIMLAPGAHHQQDAADVWPQIAANCDIICVQGYQRRPQGGVSHEANIRFLQQICDAAGSHLWMDMEIFGFEHPDKPGPQTEGYARKLADGTEDFIKTPLIPQTIERTTASLQEFDQIEFVVAYQYPGLLCHPDARKRLGGERAVQFYREYQDYLTKL